MDHQKIKTSVTDGVATITLSDPATLNAASRQLMEELRDALTALGKDGSGARAIILTGEGRGFCAGAAMSSSDTGFSNVGEVMEELANPLIDQFRTSPIPIVTAVNGVAAGVGCSMALMGDLVVAAESASFIQAFRRVGLVPDGGATWLLSRLVGKARAMELTLLGEKLPARTALEWGMINRCVPDDQLMAAAFTLAKALADGPKALAYTRRMIWDGMEASWAEQLHSEAEHQNIAGETEDSREGVAAFLEKRAPVFKGR